MMYFSFIILEDKYTLNIANKTKNSTKSKPLFFSILHGLFCLHGLQNLEKCDSLKGETSSLQP